MNPAAPEQHPATNATPETVMAMRFANLVAQQTNLALMFLGTIPHPDTGRTFLDLESARVLIDQLEMLESKTRGNLDQQEAQLLQQSLTRLRLAFVEAVDRRAEPAPAPTPAPSSPPPEDSAASATHAADAAEPRKKFSKKY